MEPPAVVVALALAGGGVDLLVLPLVAGQGPVHVPLPRLGPVHRTHRWTLLGNSGVTLYAGLIIPWPFGATTTEGKEM